MSLCSPKMCLFHIGSKPCLGWRCLWISKFLLFAGEGRGCISFLDAT